MESKTVGVAVFYVTDPYATRYINYVNNRDFNTVVNLTTNPGAAGDLGPEGIAFIAATDSPTGGALIAVANEISGTTTLFSVVVEVCLLSMPGMANQFRQQNTGQGGRHLAIEVKV